MHASSARCAMVLIFLFMSVLLWQQFMLIALQNGVSGYLQGLCALNSPSRPQAKNDCPCWACPILQSLSSLTPSGKLHLVI